MIREKRRAYKVLFLVNFLSCLGLGAVDPFFPIYVTQNGATPFHIALMFSGYAAAKMLMSPLSGWLSDQRGRRGMLTYGLIVYAVVSVFFLLFSHLYVLILLKFALGFAAGIVRPVLLALVGDIAPEKREGAAMGTFDISFYGALAIGPVLGGILRDMYGFPAIFLSLSLFCFLALSVLLLLYGYSGRKKDMMTSRPTKKAFRVTRTMAALSAFIFTKSVGITLLTIFLPLFMVKKLELTGVQIGVIMAASTVMTTLFLKPIGVLSDRKDRFQLVTAGGITAALLASCIPFVRSFSHLLSLVAVLGIFSTLSLPPSSALLVKEGGTLGMGVTVGVFNGALNLGALTAPLIGGVCLTYLGMDSVFYAASTISLAGVLFFRFSTISIRSR